MDMFHKLKNTFLLYALYHMRPPACHVLVGSQDTRTKNSERTAHVDQIMMCCDGRLVFMFCLFVLTSGAQQLLSSAQ